MTHSKESRIPSIAVILTCHNRKTVTLKTIARLFEQEGTEAFNLDVYLVDDGSRDGTDIEIQQTYPSVKILKGDGSLFWNGAMRLGFETAIKQGYDYYLWLNDDTFVFTDAIKTLLTTYQQLIAQNYPFPIISGATWDENKKITASSGFNHRQPSFLFRFQIVEPQSVPVPCEAIAGNCVLIHHSIAQKVGNLDSRYTHYIGDLDYGLRAKQLGCTLWIAPKHIGMCAADWAISPFLGKDQPISYIARQLNHPKGITYGGHFQKRLPPPKEWSWFLRKHGGWLWFIPFILTYSKLLIVFWEAMKNRYLSQKSR